MTEKYDNVLHYSVENYKQHLFLLYFFVGHAPHFDVAEDNKDITLKLKNIIINKRWSKDTYIFHDLHIHLGKKENKGSEHSIDGKFYPMEVTFKINDEHAFVLNVNEQALFPLYPFHEQLCKTRKVYQLF